MELLQFIELINSEMAFACAHFNLERPVCSNICFKLFKVKISAILHKKKVKKSLTPISTFSKCRS